MDRKVLGSSILSGFAWQGVTRLVIQVFSWATTIIVARILSPEDYGLVALQGIFTVTLSVFVDMGISRGLINKTEITDRQIDSVFYFSLMLGFFTYLLYYFSAPFLELYFNLAGLAPLMQVAGLSFILGSASGVPLALAMRKMDFRYRSMVELGGAFAHSGSLLLFAATGFGVWSLIYSHLIHYLVTTMAYLPIIGRIPRPRLIFAEIWDIVSFGVKITAARLLNSFYMKSDIFFLGKLGGEKSTGFYSMAFQIATIPLDKIGTVFNEVAFPAISKIKGDTAHAKKIFFDMHRYLLFLSLPLLVGLSLISRPVVELLLGEKWLPVAPVLTILCLVNVLRLSGMIMTPVLQGLARVDMVLRYNLWCAALLPVAFYIGSRHGGYIGVAYAWGVAYPIAYAYLLVAIMRQLNFSILEFLFDARVPLICCGVMTLVLVVTIIAEPTLPGPLQLALMITLGVISYFGSLMLLFRGEVRLAVNGFRALRAR